MANIIHHGIEVTQINGLYYLNPQPKVTVYGKPGVAVYATKDLWFGVRLDGEGKRVDEYQPSQVQGVL